MDLLERDSQLQIANDMIKNVFAGEGAIVLVSGEAGIGKTSFVKALCETVRPQVGLFLGACDPLFTPRPLGPIYDIAVRELPALPALLNSGADWISTAACTDLRHTNTDSCRHAAKFVFILEIV